MNKIKQWLNQNQEEILDWFSHRIYNIDTCRCCKRIEITYDRWCIFPFESDIYYHTKDLCFECAHYAKSDWAYETMRQFYRIDDPGKYMTVNQANVQYPLLKMSKRAWRKNCLQISWE